MLFRSSVKAAVDTSVSVLQMGIPIAKIEFLDELSMAATNSYHQLGFPAAPTLFLEFNGSPQSVEEQATIVSEYSVLGNLPLW